MNLLFPCPRHSAARVENTSSPQTPSASSYSPERAVAFPPVSLAAAGWPASAVNDGELSCSSGQELFQRYCVVRSLVPEGQTALSRVYLAQHIDDPDRLVAIKIEAPTHQEVPSLPGAELEAWCLANGGGYTPKLVDTFLIDGRFPCIVMEHLPGMNGQEFMGYAREMGQNPPLSGDAQRWLARRLGSAMLHLHNLGVSLNDIKPRNVLVNGLSKGRRTRQSRAHLLDFNLARRHERGTRANGLPQGTPRFSAPECFGSAPFNPFLSDQFRLGATLYALCTGAPLVQDEGSRAVQACIQSGAYLSSLHESTPADMSPQLVELLRRLMRPDPNDRFLDPHELRRAL